MKLKGWKTVRIVDAGFEIMTPLKSDEILKHLELVGRVCYKSEDKITDTSAAAFIAKIIERGHEAIIEHYGISVKFIVDRGVSHELVRHRIASWAQESTRYCDYSKGKYGGEISFIRPFFWTEGDQLPYAESEYKDWMDAMTYAESAYMKLMEKKASPQEARSVLPNSLKTEVVMTANLREWRHFFILRTADAAHPQMREVTRPLLIEFAEKIKVIFDDIIKNATWISDESKAKILDTKL